MEFLNNIANGVKGYFDKKAEEREIFDKLQKEAEMQRRQIFIEEFKKNSLEVAKQAAQNDALHKSGLAKLRARNRMIQLEKQGQEPGTVFSKLAEYTQKNIARRQENLRRTELMKQEVQLQQTDNREKKLVYNEPPFANKRAFGRSTWRQ